MCLFFELHHLGFSIFFGRVELDCLEEGVERSDGRRDKRTKGVVGYVVNAGAGVRNIVP